MVHMIFGLILVFISFCDFSVISFNIRRLIKSFGAGIEIILGIINENYNTYGAIEGSKIVIPIIICFWTTCFHTNIKCNGH